MINPRIFFAIMLIAGDPILAPGQEPAPLPVEISPADPALAYSGRFDMRDKAAPRCAWPACAVTLKFSGAALNAKFNDEGHNYWQVAIDGRPAGKLALQRGPLLYSIATGLPAGEHIVTLTKATEGYCGESRFLGFQADAGAKPLPLPPAQRRIEVIGDSISCGYGVEAASGKEPFFPETENACLAYGFIAAGKLGADYTCIAYSGRKMWPDDTIPEIYGQTLVRNDVPAWDFTQWTPDVVIINLGTNDFANENPDEALWTDAYRKFIGRVRKNYPKAAIYCATGPLLSDDASRKAKSTLLDYVKKIVASERALGDENIHLLDFGQVNPADGFGANNHPSLKTQQLMAALLVETLQHDMGWH